MVSALPPALAEAFAGRYRLLDLLRRSWMEEVWLAEQVQEGQRKLALRILRDPDSLGRFQNEAALTGRISHPNVAAIYEFGQATDGTTFLSMELVAGESLAELLGRRGPLAIPEALEIAGQCCRALHAAHRVGIVHRDVKPEHIVVHRETDEHLTVKLLGFGIGKLRESGGHTVTGNIVGTPTYMSYEQACGLSSGELDGRSDVYSLGVVTYAMLAGHPPFGAETMVGCIMQHLSEDPPPIRHARADVPPALEAALRQALEKDRDRRYRTALEFEAALRAAAAPAPRASTLTGQVAP